jgi:cytochrome c556
MRGASYCPESKVINQDILNEKIINSVLTQYKNLKNIQKFTEAYSQRTIKSSQSKLNGITKQINQLLVKQSKTKKTTELNRINNEIQSFINERSSLISNQLVDINFNELYQVDLKTFNRFSISKQQSVIRQYIQKVIVKRDTIEIVFPFVVNSKGSKSITIQH